MEIEKWMQGHGMYAFVFAAAELFLSSTDFLEPFLGLSCGADQTQCPQFRSHSHPLKMYSFSQSSLPSSGIVYDKQGHESNAFRCVTPSAVTFTFVAIGT